MIEVKTWLFKTIEDTSKEFQIRLMHNLKVATIAPESMNDIITDAPNISSPKTNTPILHNVS